MSVTSNVRRRLSNVVKKFRFEELESAVLPNFPETTWNRLRARLVKHHKTFSVANALCMIEQAITEAKVSERELTKRLETLELLAVSRHHKKRIWYAFMMHRQDGNVEEFRPNREIETKIKESFRVREMKMDVGISSNDGITFVSIRDKPRSKRGKLTSPVFFAFSVGQPYLFCSKQSVTKECMTVLAESLGYTAVKKLKLMGRELNSLMKMLWMKEQGAVDCNELNDPPELRMAKLVVNKTGIDFRQNKQRREYVERCFGAEPPKLESLVAIGPETSWRDSEIAAKLPEEKVRMGWQFRSLDIAATLTKLTEHRVFVMPLPAYVENLMKTGKNQLKIQQG